MNQSIRDQIRNKNFISHCKEITLFQEKGMCLTGYGTFKINKVGTLYLEFICTKAINLPSDIPFFSEVYPKDALIDEQRFSLIAKTLNDDVVFASDFNIKLSFSIFNLPNILYVFLSNISTSESYNGAKTGYLYLETEQVFQIPANKLNKIESTLGESSSTWNETIFDYVDLGLNIRFINNHKNKSYIEVKGQINFSIIYNCLKMYLGLTTGKSLQYYFSAERKQDNNIRRVHSINTRDLTHDFMSVIPSNLADKNNKLTDKHHRDFLKNILDTANNNETIFNSIFVQWKRLWDASKSTQQILDLVLSTSIEGLLNDIFIPEFEKNVDQELLNDIEDIKKKIKLLDINSKYKERLQNTISYLKTVTATNALNLLVQRGVLSKEEVKAWKKLRNDVAHPKNNILNIEEQKVYESNFLLCCNLFNSLVFQALGYEGGRYYFQNSAEPRIIDFKVKNILFS